MNWTYLDFDTRLRTTTPLYSIKKLLKERHGRTEELRLYKETPTSDCELTNDMLTLEQVGVEGRTKTEMPPKAGACSPACFGLFVIAGCARSP